MISMASSSTGALVERVPIQMELNELAHPSADILKKFLLNLGRIEVYHAEDYF